MTQNQSTQPQSQKGKIASIELLRVLSMLVIIAMHCQMMLTYWQFDEVPWVGYIFNQITRFAVPCFFLISGFLIQPKLVQAPIETFKSYSKPLFKVWLVWSVISLAMPFNLGVVAEHGYLAERQGYWGYLMQTPVNTLFEGGLVHLWFIPALIIAVGIMAVLLNSKKASWIFPLGLGLYVYGVLAGSYVNLTEIWSPIFTRNGPFFSLLMVAIGFMVREKNIQFKSGIAMAIAFLGLLMHFCEALWLTHFDVAFNIHDFLFGTAIWGTGTFLWFLSKPNLGNQAWVFNIAKSVLGIYVSHLLFVIIMNNVAGINGLHGASKDLTVIIGTLILALLFVKGIEKTPLAKILLR
ncbi:acyltransferase [Vibrio maerlii]|uniref:acyltransferase n=1 Tax=Vibrio maerlii TaxID=2231648 RepID=UPI000E3DA67C|nr:acyltransferase family protein [Vibrio maerlii]